MLKIQPYSAMSRFRITPWAIAEMTHFDRATSMSKSSKFPAATGAGVLGAQEQQGAQGKKRFQNSAKYRSSTVMKSSDRGTDLIKQYHQIWLVEGTQESHGNHKPRFFRSWGDNNKWITSIMSLKNGTGSFQENRAYALGPRTERHHSLIVRFPCRHSNSAA